MPINCSKGEAILWLADYLNIPHNQTMAFGDSMNDESMILKAEHGVAMANALEHIKNVANYVTLKDNNNDGIADFLEQFVF
jgi:hydroxymethylpyrimidine pyrophosphatase-like HAD family hydrolase